MRRAIYTACDFGLAIVCVFTAYVLTTLALAGCNEPKAGKTAHPEAGKAEPPPLKVIAPPPPKEERAAVVLKRRCYGCHGGEKPKGDLDLKAAGTDLSKHAEAILDRVTTRNKDLAMPPARRMTLRELAEVFAGLSDLLPPEKLQPKAKADGSEAEKDPG